MPSALKRKAVESEPLTLDEIAAFFGVGVDALVYVLPPELLAAGSFDRRSLWILFVAGLAQPSARLKAALAWWSRRANGATRRTSISAPQRARIYRRDRSTCRYCLAVLPDAARFVDHVIPVSQGGGNADRNLVTACSPCNRIKGPRRPEEAGMTLHPIAVAVIPALQKERDELAAAGTPSVYLRKDGLWAAAVTLKPDPMTGKRRTKTFYGKTAKEARAKLAAAKAVP